MTPVPAGGRLRPPGVPRGGGGGGRLCARRLARAAGFLESAWLMLVDDSVAPDAASAVTVPAGRSGRELIDASGL